MMSRKARQVMGKACAASLALFIACTIAFGIPAHAAETWSQYARIGPTPSSDLGSFNSPIGMATDSLGNVYVADSANQRVQKLNKATNSWQTISSNLGFNGPVGVAVDGAGNIYVSEFYSNRVQKLDASTNTWSSWTGFNKPYGIAVDSGGNVYVADSGNNRIQKLAAGGGGWSELAGSGSTSGKVKGPYGVAVDGSGNLYVADTGNNRIQKLTGGTWSQWGNGTTSGTVAGQFSSPYGVTVDSAGNVYVADTGNQRVQKLTAGDTAWSEWKKSGGGNGSGLGEFNSPMGVTVGQDGTMYVADTSNHRVQKLTGGTWSEWGAIGTASGNGTGEFNKPYSLAVNGGGDLYVADLLNKRIQKLTVASGTWSSYGTTGQFTNPAGVAIDKNGNIYVADMGNNYGGHKVHKLSATGTSLTSWGKSDSQSGTALGQFNGAEGVAVDKNGNVYVADTGNNRIQKLTVSNNTWSAWGKSGNASGTGLGEFNKPSDVAVDGDGNVYVGDTNNNRVQKLTVSTGQWSEWKNSGSAPGSFNSPRGVAVDGSGNVYVADVGRSRIQKLTVATNTWSAWGKSGGVQGTGLGEFFNPYGVAIDANGVLYVADMNNHRVQKLVITVTAPNEPTGATAKAGNGQATVSFTPPADNGGSPITGYTVTSNPGGKTASGTASPITVSGLTNLTAYTFTVVATNAKGDSVPSAPTGSVTPAAEPDAPTGATATAGKGQATVSFTPPVDNGGSAITGYTVTSSPGGLTGTGSASPITVSGLTNGTAYTFTVVATNGIGNSAASGPSASVTPVAEPSAPTGLSVVALSGTALVSFTPPSDNGGSPVTGYTVTSNPGGLTASGTTSPIAVTGLTNGTAYTFTVVATNAVGDSVPSAPSASATPASMPGAPTEVTAVATGSGQATISFTPPGSNGGSAITGYTVTSSPGGLTGTG
ncbi:fibronectin type III domain-containing protein, partial [Paenibacillus hemerocallicola]